MATKRWLTTLDGTTYTVEAKISAWTGTARIFINGAELAKTERSRKDPWRVFFPLGRHSATLVAIAYGPAATHYDVIVDGRSLSTGGQPRPPANPYESRAMSWALLILVGAILAGVLWFAALPEARLALEGREVAAQVTGKHEVSGRSTTYHLSYTFTTASGQVRRADGRVGYATYRAIRPGDRITVLYVPADPEIQRPASFDERWAILALLGMFGAGLAYTVMMVWRAERLRSTNAALAERGMRTSAVVSDVKTVLFGQRTMRVSYEYRDLEGRPRQGRSPTLYAEEAAAYPRGATATIAYDPNAPDRSMWIGAADPNATVWIPVATDRTGS